jgi:hypothetical protein
MTKDIGDDHHVLRWVPKTKLRHDPDTFDVLGPLPIAFRLRKEINEEYLSVSWVEHASGSYSEQLERTAKLLAKQVKATPTKGGAFAEGAAGDIRKACADQSGVKVRIWATPTGKSPAYGKVYGIEADDESLQAVLAYGCWGKTHLAKDVLE